jgi:hypothetical protein
MKLYGGADVPIHVLLTLALAEGEWSASHPGDFIPPIWRSAPWTHQIGGQMGPRASLDSVEKRKFLTLLELDLHLFNNSAHSQFQLRYPLYVQKKF